MERDPSCARCPQVRALAELLPMLDVVEGDAFNSSPTDPKYMGPDALARFRAGEKLPTVQMRTPLVELPLGATEDRICGTIDIEKALTEGACTSCSACCHDS
jgi:Mg-chelatase subunit ChlI